MAPGAGEWVLFAHRGAGPQQTATAFSPQTGLKDLNAAVQPQGRAGVLAHIHWDVPPNRSYSSSAPPEALGKGSRISSAASLDGITVASGNAAQMGIHVLSSYLGNALFHSAGLLQNALCTTQCKHRGCLVSSDASSALLDKKAGDVQQRCAVLGGRGR